MMQPTLDVSDTPRNSTNPLKASSSGQARKISALKLKIKTKNLVENTAENTKASSPFLSVAENTLQMQFAQPQEKLVEQSQNPEQDNQNEESQLQGRASQIEKGHQKPEQQAKNKKPVTPSANQSQDKITQGKK